MRSAFTLVEVLVALVLFEFGMLALSASTALTARRLGTALRQTRAQALAASRVEQLRAQACTLATSGEEARPGLRELWRVDVLGRRRMITDSVEIALPGSRRISVVRRGWIVCTD